MTPDQLIGQLRAEVKDVKECFTQFAFQSAALATVAAGFILNVIDDQPWVAFAGVPIVVVLLLVCRVGIFKYTTANRNLGYQLHLERLEAYRADLKDAPEALDRIRSLESLGWEEALRAWRVVHASLFVRLYTVPKLKKDRSGRGPVRWPTEVDPNLYRVRPDYLKVELATQGWRLEPAKSALDSSRSASYSWWNQQRATEPNEDLLTDAISHYHTGNFLRTMLGGLYFVSWCYVPLIFWGVIGVVVTLDGWVQIGVGTVLALLSTAGVVSLRLRQRRLTRRREILEDELVSIHSCALVWGAVAIAHYTATMDGDRLYSRYTERLARLSDHLDLLTLPSKVDSYIRLGQLPFAKAAYVEGLANRRREAKPLPFGVPKDRRAS